MCTFGRSVSSKGRLPGVTEIQESKNQAEGRPIRSRRNIGLFSLVVILLVISGYGWLRFEQAIVNWDFLDNLGLSVGSLYFAMTGLLWGAGGLFLGLALWFRRRWAPLWTRIGLVIMLGSYWAERLGLHVSPESRNNQVFVLLITLFVLGYGFLILALPAQKRFFTPPIAREGKDRSGDEHLD